jgi:hypothetical protein
MATVKHQIAVGAAQFLASAFPQIVKNNGTNFPVFGLAFDGAGSTEEKAYWRFKASNYGSGNLTLVLRWYADSGTTGDVVFGARIAAITPDTDSQDVETDGLATQQTVTDSHLGTTAQRVHTCSITISNLDSVAADDEVFVEISRLPGNASDTMSADAILIGAEVQYSDA